MRAEKNHTPHLRFKARYKVITETRERTGLTVFSFVTGKTLALNSLDQVKSHPAHLGKYIDKRYGDTDCHSILCIPLKAGTGECIGVLKLEHTLKEGKHKKFSESTKSQLEQLSSVAAEAIINFESQVSKVDKAISLILSNSVKFGKSGGLTKRLRKIARTFKEISNAVGVSIWLIEGAQLVCKAAVGPSYKALEKVKYSLPTDLGEQSKIGLIPWSAKNGKTINIKTHEQIISHPQYIGVFDNILHPGELDRCESLICTPLKIGNKVIGVIKAYNRIREENHPERYFTTEESQIFLYLSIITSVVVEGMQQFQLKNKHDKKLLDLYKLGTECYELNNVKDMLWYLLVGLTNGEGIGFNRVMMFRFNHDLNAPSLTGVTALGPRDKYEARKLQTILESGANFDIDFCKVNPVESTLSGFVRNKKIYLTTDCSLYKRLLEIINDECFPVQLIEVLSCSRDVQDCLSELDSRNENIHIFALSDAAGQTYLGICDSMYFNSNSIDEFCENAANTFINQISIALSRLSLEKSKREAKEKAWREFSAITAHRIGTETAIISGSLGYLKENSQILVKPKMRAMWEEEIEDLENAVGTLAMAVREYTELQKAPAKEYKKIDLSDLLTWVKHDIEKLLSTTSKKINIVSDYPNSLPPIHGDSDCLAYAFKELLDNAIKALNEGGEVNISTTIADDNEYIEICVSDNGVGIREEVIERIFEPGFKDRNGGTGLGLHIVKKYIELHQGKVEVNNNPFGGAAFSVFLKISRPKKNVERRLLLVEDNKVSRKQILRSIKEKMPSFKVDVAVNEDDAIELIERRKTVPGDSSYDFIVADVNLEGGGGSRLGGIHILEHIENNNVKTKIIVLTAHQKLTYRDKEGEETSVLEKTRELNIYKLIPKNQLGKNYLDELSKALLSENSI